MVLSCMFVGLFCIGYDIHVWLFLQIIRTTTCIFVADDTLCFATNGGATQGCGDHHCLRRQRQAYAANDCLFGYKGITTLMASGSYATLCLDSCSTKLIVLFCDVCCTYLWQNFLDYFMRGLSYEYRNSGVTFQCLMPFYVATRMTSYSSTLSKASVLIPSARTYVQHALSTLGWTSRTSGYWPHTVQVSLRLSRVHCCMYVHAGVLALSTQHGSMAVDFLAFFMRIELKAVVFHCHD